MTTRGWLSRSHSITTKKTFCRNKWELYSKNIINGCQKRLVIADLIGNPMTTRKNISRNKKNESCLIVKFDIRLHLVRLRVKVFLNLTMRPQQWVGLWVEPAMTILLYGGLICRPFLAMMYRGWHDNPFLSSAIQHLLL